MVGVDETAAKKRGWKQIRQTAASASSAWCPALKARGQAQKDRQK